MTTRGARARIRAPKKNLADEANFDVSWNEKLSPAIREIYEKNASKRSFEELYRTAYYLVLKKHGKRLYESTKQQIRDHLENEVIGSLRRFINDKAGDEGIQNGSIPTDFLKQIRTFWDDSCLCIKMTSDILMYLDRVYVSEAKVPLMYDAGLILFRDAIIFNENLPIGEIIYDIIIREVINERNGKVIDRVSIKGIVNMLESLPDTRLGVEDISLSLLTNDLKRTSTSSTPPSPSSSNNRSIRTPTPSLSLFNTVYTSCFEPKFLLSSRDYFTLAADDLLENTPDGHIYINKVKQWLDEESQRCNRYLSIKTLNKLIKLTEQVLITDKIYTVMSLPTGFIYWIDNDKYDDLSLLYELSSRIDNYEFICEFIKRKVLEQGREINNQAVRNSEEVKKGNSISISWVQDILKLKEKFDKILSVCFKGQSNIRISIEESFMIFINENLKVAEFLSLFIDDNLKKSIKGKSEEEIEDTLEKAISLFRYISDKDLFETYYKAHLAKRLLNNKSISDDVERNMISKIKREVGTAFTSKLEGMFKDMRISKDINGEFKMNLQEEKEDKHLPEIQVNILTSTFWPTGIVNSQVKFVLPTVLQETRENFEKFYLSRHNGRVLSWNMSMGTVDIKARFKKRTHEINLSTIAMVILMLFNELPADKYLTFEDIQNTTGIANNELVRHLQSIAVVPKTRLLRKEPMSRDVKPTDKFYFNDKFESPMARIKVLAVSAKSKQENDSERKETLDKVDQSRRFETDAAIVRIMKSRRTLEHVQLISDVTRQLSSRFKPDPILIKQRIDALLEREYLERDSERRNVYNYLA